MHYPNAILQSSPRSTRARYHYIIHTIDISDNINNYDPSSKLPIFPHCRNSTPYIHIYKYSRKLFAQLSNANYYHGEGGGRKLRGEVRELIAN